MCPERQDFPPSITNVSRLVFTRHVTVEAAAYLPVPGDVSVVSVVSITLAVNLQTSPFGAVPLERVGAKKMLR